MSSPGIRRGVRVFEWRKEPPFFAFGRLDWSFDYWNINSQSRRELAIVCRLSALSFERGLDAEETPSLYEQDSGFCCSRCRSILLRYSSPIMYS